MPFKSDSQRRWMFENHPEMAKRWAAETPEGAKLPEHVSHAIDNGMKAQKAADKVHLPKRMSK